MDSDCEVDSNLCDHDENVYEKDTEQKPIKTHFEESNISNNIEDANELTKANNEMENNNSSVKSHEQVYEVPSPEPPSVPKSKDESKTSRVKQEPQKSSGTSCEVCSKTVYPMEKILMDNKIYHKLCFRCCKCQKALSPTVVSKMNGNLFCKPHYIELFKKRGRYDDIDVSKQSPDQETSTQVSSFPAAVTSNQSYEKTASNSQAAESKNKPVSAKDLATKFQDMSSSNKDTDKINAPRKQPIDLVVKRRVSDVTKTWENIDSSVFNQENNRDNTTRKKPIDISMTQRVCDATKTWENIDSSLSPKENNNDSVPRKPQVDTLAKRRVSDATKAWEENQVDSQGDKKCNTNNNNISDFDTDCQSPKDIVKNLSILYEQSN